MSSDIANALFSIVVKAPADVALLHNPSEKDPGRASIGELLQAKIGFITSTLQMTLVNEQKLLKDSVA